MGKTGKKNKTRFGLRLRELRTRMDMTQQQLAEKVGVSPKYISNIERGISYPSFTVLEGLSLALGVELSVLFEYDEDRVLFRSSGQGAGLAESLSFYHSVFDCLGDRIAVVDPKGLIVSFNKSWEARARAEGLKDSSRLIGTGYVEFLKSRNCLPGTILTEFFRGLRKVLAGDIPFFDLEHPCPDEDRACLVRAIRLDGLVEGAVIVHQDQSPGKKHEDDLLGDWFLVKGILDRAPLAIYIKNVKFEYIYVNKHFCRLCGYSEDQVLGLADFDLFPAEVAEKANVDDRKVLKFQAVIETEEYAPVEGESHCFLTLKFPLLDARGEIRGICGISNDIHDRKRRQEILENSLREKSNLLAEIHHRLKNNLQILISLLNLQLKNENNPSVVQAVQNAQQRLIAVSTLHEAIYSCRDFTKVNFKDYVSRISHGVKGAYKLSRNHDNIILEIPDHLELETDQSLYVGLALNELLNNAFKHASKDSEKVKVRISAQKVDGRLELVISDNGRGLHEMFDWRNSGKLGLSLVTTLVEKQCKGMVELNLDHGTCWKITI